ncbi:DinB family protein [uncultured Tenacibaculum sp.]|uniref:DinB family protein n=1 Tax=uncultured Tenacibaculum sp. TaxID=174713 RepID=UPI00262A4F0C|nr:DinB family protein [uncultured Tenacibaculum sp.]
MNEELLNEFKEQIIFRLDESSRMNMKSLALISEEDVWKRFNQSSNSIGNLILHLCGNITQYAIASLGNKEDQRNRDLEFSTEEGYTKAELLSKLSATVQEAKRIILETSQEEYLRKREVQGFNFSGIGIVIHVTEHYSYHTGQIAFWIKQLKNKDLGFYDGIDLTVKNKQ